MAIYPMTASEGEIIEAFADALGVEKREIDQGAMTREELSDAFGISVASVGRRLNKPMKNGAIEKVYKVIETSDGRRLTVPAYRLAR